MRLAFGVSALTAVCLISSSAAADQEQAKVHYARAKSYFELRDYRHALEEFKAAHVEKADPAFLFNIAECHRLLGEPADATFFYRRFLAVSPPGGKLRADAEARIAEIEKSATTPPPAGASAGPQPPPPPAMAPLPQSGGALPAPAAAPSSPTTNTTTSTTTLLSQSAEPTPPRAGRKTAAYVVGGIAVGALVTGSIFGWRAISKRHDSDTQCPDAMGRCTEQAVTWNEQALTAAHVSDVAFGVGLASAAAATYLLLTSGSKSATSPGIARAVHVTPEVGPTQAGLGLGGSW